MKKKGFWKNVWQFKALILMALPGVIWFIFFFYIPVFVNVVAFKDFRLSPDGFFASLQQSPWVGFDNFKFLFASNDAWLITRNTLLYNIVFLAFNLFFAIAFAIVMSELRNKRLVKVYHTMSLLPYFLSWVVISYFVYAFLSPDKGIINQWITNMGGEGINWYADPKWWPFIFVFMNVWKSLGYNSIIYYASVMGIDQTYYEAAMVDGANKMAANQKRDTAAIIADDLCLIDFEYWWDLPGRLWSILPSSSQLRCIVSSFFRFRYLHL